MSVFHRIDRAVQHGSASKIVFLAMTAGAGFAVVGIMIGATGSVVMMGAM